MRISFVDDDGQPLEIRRIWHFSDARLYRPQDEEVYIYYGETRKVVGPERLTGGDRLDWFRDYIAENLLPFTLAHFFMFDGEQVSVLAEREMSVQVRQGIEGLLGIPVLKQLARDLSTYAAARRRETPNVSNQTIERLESERDRLTDDREGKSARLRKVEPSLIELKRERDTLTRELASFGAGSKTLLREQCEKMKSYEGLIDERRTKLERLLSKDIALSLCGIGLRRLLEARLESEAIRERWESAKDQGDTNLERFLNAIEISMGSVDPTLTESQRAAILDAARGAWEELWHPPPINCSESYRHPFLNNLERANVSARLRELDDLSAPVIVELLNSIATGENELRRIQQEVERTEAVAPHVDSKRERLSALYEEIRELDQEAGALQRETEALESQINSKNAELARAADQSDAAKPAERRAMRALKVSSMVDEIVTKAVPNQIDVIAKEMTKAHASMSHKKDLVDRVHISEDCNVQLLNEDGVDVRAYDLSAGEKQIFTQSLISAVSSVSGRIFPMLIDTPLGRLDIEHRKGVLRHLANREQQVILLSTDTEVVGEYLREVEAHVQKSYLLHFSRFGESTARVGYFDEREKTT